jgi:predicted ATPase
MAEPKQSSKNTQHQAVQGITKISVRGYKSIEDECTIDIYPLTILAGANSSGKSSIMQPLLLIKQTLEAPYDPGALLLNGPNVRFTSVDQLLTKHSEKNLEESFSVEIEVDLDYSIKNTFKRDSKKAIDIVETYYRKDNYTSIVSSGMTAAEIDLITANKTNDFQRSFFNNRPESISSSKWRVIRERCYLKLELEIERSGGVKSAITTLDGVDVGLFYTRKIIHVPGLRGNPERTYPVTAIGDNFPGTFENYVASLIANWQDEASDKLADLARSLKALGLTEKVDVRKVDDTKVEVRVGHQGKNTIEMVSIADVGFGVSQTLPVIVALIAANPQQLVYIEQPEIHLHPRAQAALADIIVEAVNRGVRVTLETHSDLFLRRIQSLVAEDKLAHDKVKLHWFTKDEDGFTQVSTANLDPDGSFGDWPEDFGDVDLQEESRYLDAADKKLARKSHG